MVFVRPAIVYRSMYAGRGIIAPNWEFSSEMTDCRGYLPVEWWIMSHTEAKNPIPQQNEGVHISIRHSRDRSLLAGVTSLLIRGRPVLLTDALKWAESELMGSFAQLWPLTKMLDIGGVSRTPIVSAGTLGMPLAEPNEFWQGCEIVPTPSLELALEYANYRVFLFLSLTAQRLRFLPSPAMFMQER